MRKILSQLLDTELIPQVKKHGNLGVEDVGIMAD